ncbi:MAG: hypothetical protein WBD46_12905 [Acidobacteriaceae bacterium]
MNFAPLERIADAVLYEGYILYPYRPSSLKNRQRWNFGTLVPRTWAERQQPPEAWSFQAEVLVAGTAGARVSARVRFLQLIPGADDDPGAWSEGVVRSGGVEGIALGELAASWVREVDFGQPGRSEKNPGVMPVGRLRMEATLLRDGLWRLRAVFANETTTAVEDTSPADAQSLACVSAHLLLGVEGGAFVSLLDPGAEVVTDAATCVNRGVFPVLAGETGDRSRMLCSPIILYDHPRIAPESTGDFFDGTEMDEMLALRVLTLTDEEEAEMRQGDARAAAILERTQTLPAEHLMKLHGAVRGMRPAAPGVTHAEAQMEPWNPFEEAPAVESVRVFGVEVRKGDRVRLWPGRKADDRKADILDMAMHGKVAMVEAIEQDLEGNLQFAVVLEDDPGRDMGLLRQAGHRFFFSPEEIEPLRVEVP